MTVEEEEEKNRSPFNTC